MDWLIAAWVVMSIVAAVIAEEGRRRNGFLWLAISLVVSPFISILVLAFLPRLDDKSILLKTCPHCAETIKHAANYCRYCGNNVDADI